MIRKIPYYKLLLFILLILSLLIFSCDLWNPIIEGCTTSIACNYNPEAKVDDNSCIDPLGCNDWCPGDTTTVKELDCIGVCGGLLLIDCSGQCGILALDECDVCGGNNASCIDCNGVINGSAFQDGCGECVGGNTGLNECNYDCLGNLGGGIMFDVCGVCGGDGTSCYGCTDPDALNFDADATKEDLSCDYSINYAFPLNIGNTWTYDYYHTQRLYEDPDYEIINYQAEMEWRTLVPEIGELIDTIFYQVMLTIISQKFLFDTLNVYELEFNFVNADTSFYQFAYINEDISGLYLYATKEQYHATGVYLNYLPRSDNDNYIRFDKLFTGTILSNSLARCDGQSFTKWKNPLKVLKYPVQLNEFWVNVNLEATYQDICETDNEIMGTHQTQLFAEKGYTDISDGCLMTTTYASLPNLSSNLDYVFAKEYCDDGIKSTLNTYKIGAQTFMDAWGNELDISTSYRKMEVSFKLTDTNVIPNN